jgi:predicted metalloprotease with PDZ domain
VLYLETGVASQRFFSRWHCDLGMFLAESFTGLGVTEVAPGGWAQEAGVQAGDLVLYVDSLPIFERTDLWPFQISRRLGDRLTIEVARNGSRVQGEAPLRRIATAPDAPRIFTARTRLSHRNSQACPLEAHSAPAVPFAACRRSR